jgi:hypothetical protein
MTYQQIKTIYYKIKIINISSKNLQTFYKIFKKQNIANIIYNIEQIFYSYKTSKNQ